MNKIVLIGNISKEPEMSTVGQNQTVKCAFSIAVNRKFKDQTGQYPTDFFNCIAWGKTAQFIGTYFHKGQKIALTGEMQNRSYQDSQTGATRYITECIVDAAEFVEKKETSAPAPQPTPPPAPAPAPLAPDMNEPWTVPGREKVEVDPLDLPFEI